MFKIVPGLFFPVLSDFSIFLVFDLSDFFVIESTCKNALAELPMSHKLHPFGTVSLKLHPAGGVWQLLSILAVPSMVTPRGH